MRSCLLLASLLTGQAVHAADKPKKPNILLISSDDQSYKTVGCSSESWPWVKTPNIDGLATSGVRFQGAYLGGWCMPSRASILTGHLHGIQSKYVSYLQPNVPEELYDLGTDWDEQKNLIGEPRHAKQLPISVMLSLPS